MGARIRLRRVGRKKQSSFRIVVTDRAAPRDGAYVEAIGFYNPRRQPAELRLDMDRVTYWLGNGASPTDTAASLIRKARAGGDESVKLYGAEEQPDRDSSPTAVRARRSERTKPKAKAAEAEAPEAEAAPAEGDAVAEAHAQADPDEAKAEAEAAEVSADSEAEANAEAEEPKAEE